MKHIPSAITILGLIVVAIVLVWIGGSAYWGTTFVTITCLTFLVYAFGPWAWATIPFRYIGAVIRFGNVVGGEQGVRMPGPIHLWAGIDYFAKVPMFTLTIVLPTKEFPLPAFPTAATGDEPSFDVDVSLALETRFKDPIRIIMSKPDRDPIEEACRYIQGMVGEAIGKHTMNQLLEPDAKGSLSRAIEEATRTFDLFELWGFQVIRVKFIDINKPPSVQRAADTRAEADAEAYRLRKQGQGEADQMRERAQGEADAVQIQRDTQGDDMFRYLEGLQTMQSMSKEGGAFHTVTTIGAGLLDSLATMLSNASGQSQQAASSAAPSHAPKKPTIKKRMRNL